MWRVAGSRSSPMGGFSATCVLAIAASMTVNGPFASCGSGGRPHLPVQLRQGDGLLHRPNRKETPQPLLPRQRRPSFGTAGCNLGCKFCQNWDTSKAREVERLSDSATPEQIAAAAVDSDCTSVAFTYNDPVIFAEYAIDAARACRERGVKTVAVTAGYIAAEARRDFFDVFGCRQRGLEGLHERVLQEALLRGAATGVGNTALPQARN